MNPIEFQISLKKKNISLETLAAKIGCSRSTMYAKANGEREFTTSELSAINKEMEYSLEEFQKIFLND